MKKFLNLKFGVMLALLLVAFAPLIFQRSELVTRADADEVLVIISPHNESLRNEFSEAFYAYWLKKTGKKVAIDWRVPGGSSEMNLLLENKFANAGGEGIGIDVCFGGGDYLFERWAKAERFQKLDVFSKRPDWFTGELGIPQNYSGEVYYNRDHYWVGACLSEFGICYNVDVLKRLQIEPPKTWDDLGDPQYFGVIAMADPTKSGSVARAFELLVQQKIHQSLATTQRRTGEDEGRRRKRAVRDGWARGLNLIQRIAANARYFTDSASKVPHDVAQGDAAAGMCVDFYGRAYNEKLKKADGSSRLQWVSPEGGTSLSADPVAVFKEAPNSKLAQGFVEFLLSDAGQVLWNKRAGTSGGPKFEALRRMPIRPSVYKTEAVKDFVDRDMLPYEKPPLFIYQPDLTAPAFDSLRYIIRNICIDPHEELQDAWAALIENEMPERALEHFHDVSYVSYVKAMEEIRLQLKSGDNVEAAEVAKLMTGIFRRNYQETVRLARREVEK